MKYRSCSNQLVRRHYVTPCSHDRHGQDKTVFSLVLSCQWCEQNWRQVKTVFSTPHRISRLDKTVLKFSVADSFDLLTILFTLLTRTRQDKTVLVGGVN